MLKRREIDDLLARHGIAALTSSGTDSQASARGGVVATVDIVPNDAAPFMRVSIGGIAATGHCPLDHVRAAAIVRALRKSCHMPSDASFDHMLANLLVKLSGLYVDSGAKKMSISDLHLHPTSYHIGQLSIDRATRGHLIPRLDPDSHDRHAVFAHRHGDSTEFPK
jgi:hypothetical protein